MTSLIESIETYHHDSIHDSQMDFYGRRLATCSSDNLIKVFELSEEYQTQPTILEGHTGPVYQVAWAHPKFGSILASCSEDGKVIIWKESDDERSKWEVAYELNIASPVNSISWAHHEYGLKLACGSKDGYVNVLSFLKGNWKHGKFQAHKDGVNGVSWAPYLTNSGELKLVTGGCDKLVKIWKSNANDKWTIINEFDNHTSIVNDVQWSPFEGVPRNIIASAAQDGIVYIWSQNILTTDEWEYFKIPFEENEIIWRVSWSPEGNILAISSGDGNVTLWKESLDNNWKQISSYF